MGSSWSPRAADNRTQPSTLACCHSTWTDGKQIRLSVYPSRETSTACKTISNILSSNGTNSPSQTATQERHVTGPGNVHLMPHASTQRYDVLPTAFWVKESRLDEALPATVA